MNYVLKKCKLTLRYILKSLEYINFCNKKFVIKSGHMVK